MKRKVKSGYVPYTPPRRVVLSRKYPFAALKPGGFLDPPYPLEERERVKQAVRYYNKTKKGCLHVSVTPDGVVVGWPKPEAK